MKPKQLFAKLLVLAFIISSSVLNQSCSHFLSGSFESLKDKMGVKIPEESDYPENDGVVLFQSNESELEYDSQYGLVSYQTIHNVRKIFKNVEDYGEVSIYFGDDEKLLEIAARTIKPDGTISDIKPEEFYTILPDVVSGAAITGSKLVKFSFPNISKNCILEYKFKKVVYSIFSGDYWRIQNFEMPTLKNQYILMVPKSLSASKLYGGYELNWNAKPYNYNFDAKPVPIMTAGDKNRTEWIITDIPEFKPEAKMPPINSCITHVKFMRNDIKDWNEMSEIYSSYFFPQLIISEKVKSLSDELTRGKTSEMEKLICIHNYVRKIRYLSISLGIGGYQPHTPDEIIEKGYGDCKDKAILLIALLNATNIKAEPVLVLTRDDGEVDPKFPSPAFNHMIVKVFVDNNSIFIDPTSRFTKIKELPWSDEDVFAFILKPTGPAKIERTPSSKSSDNIMNVDVVLNISDDMKVNVDFKVTSTGIQENHSRYGFYDKKEKDIHDGVKSNFGGELKDITIEDIKYSDPDSLSIPFEFKFNYTSAELLQKIGEDYIIDLSDFLSTPGARWLSEKERKFDIWNSYPYEDYFNITINYNNKKLKVKSLPSNITIPDDDYNYKRINFQKSDSQIECKQSFLSNSTLIKKERYGDLKKFFADVKNADKEKIVFEVVK